MLAWLKSLPEKVWAWLKRQARRLRLFKRVLELEDLSDTTSSDLTRLQSHIIICAGTCGGLFWKAANTMKPVQTGEKPEDVVWLCTRCYGAGVRKRQFRPPPKKKKGSNRARGRS